MYGLSPQDISLINGAIASIPGIQTAFIYGSRAKGNYRYNSDIDLTFEGDGLNSGHLSLLNEKLDDLLLPYTFDLSIKTKITNAALVAEIEKYGKIFFKRA